MEISNILPSANYELKTEIKSIEINKLIIENSERSDNLGMQITNKLFIGNASGENFRIISSQFPTGAFCVINGKINEQNNFTEIEIKVTVQKAFIILFSIWLLLPIYGIIASVSKIGILKTIPLFFIIISMLFFLRLFIIGKLFRKVTELGIGNLKQILKAN